MGSYQIIPNQYVLPTPGGAYYAISSPVVEPARELLFRVFQESNTPPLTAEKVQAWGEDGAVTLELIFRMQSLAWLQGIPLSREAPAGSLEGVLPNLLAKLSGSGKALLSDDQGFYLATHGYGHETAEELSALSADLSALHERHKGLLQEHLKLRSRGWGLVGAAGTSQVGFWPLYMGKQHFMLVIGDCPRFNQPAFTELIWLLARRYSH
ncbi:hypothetical protein [Nitrosococcus oceani]|uniref:Uncharacterized protein n=2 Tax=Nitrosococcus oceani TaxID=1229 RepID=Q3JES9_NITOC|nr:hypothetical protein [Nitrosococcus oceani]KFI20913.1 hypothetical protein IB75_00630 [Nitrosococcus oceani C-27]ABA56667.1 conserved hypothetical protein [Nitrosococcus oceani ATCC 19707]EDZ65484.1 hypothetical protein NOC27_2164 [Nitrosococcus oceani AFC27]KFI23996.1 hypothetical protein HW44_00620 [Nitrosococcus oceani]GEM20763.1 hypothetical protein NONS58_21850 [Nitrosococcus oceani]